MNDDEAYNRYFDWSRWAYDAQKEPPGDWTTWLFMGGRGAGKTRAGAEWVRSLVARKISPIALVGETMTEAMAVMVRGQSGLLTVCRDDETPTIRGARLIWPNKVEATLLSASDPDSFRGPQFAAAWCDEVGKWPNAEAAWDQLQFGLRLGDRPRQLATTTPRPTALLKRLLDDPATVMSRMRTADNHAHLAPDFMGQVVARYQGTVLGRQELDGELIEDLPGALWQRGMFRAFAGGDIGRIVVAVDPPVTGNASSDACGIVVAGRVGDGVAVLEDCTLKQVRPLDWARRAVAAYVAHDADAIVVEVNQGGDMVPAVIAQVDANVPVRAVRASRGKWSRAEPVAALYARGLVSHAAGLTELEDEMCSFAVDGLSDGHSPDRVDALVWAVTELLLNETRPQVRGL
ncbi:DNA-packaging protein [Devosia sp. Root635]|uniref:DNA-packaging protein n=1 Tax=Devosia sp. Root635 TaxID=1736575 RepID=UPI0007021BC0|nr:terminase family protein [Devosia sp. Root635]KRA55791.1 ATP-binding protein [Devosia sp. Root635]